MNSACKKPDKCVNVFEQIVLIRYAGVLIVSHYTKGTDSIPWVGYFFIQPVKIYLILHCRFSRINKLKEKSFSPNVLFLIKTKKTTQLSHQQKSF